MMESRTFKKLATIAAIAAQIFATPALAAIPKSDQKIDLNSFYIDVTQIKPMAPIDEISYEDVAKVIPTDIQPTNDGGHVALRIVDHSLQNLMKNPDFKNNAFVKAAADMDNMVETDMAFGGQEEGSIKHSVKIKMKAIQTVAQLDYNGLVKARFSYQVSSEKMDVEVHEDINASTKLVLAHSFHKGDSTDTVNLRWEF